MRVAVTCTQLQRDIEEYRVEFEDAGIELVLPRVEGQQLGGTRLIEALSGVDGVIAGDDEFTADVLARLPALRCISKWGIGLDAIDLGAAADRRIVVTNTPGVFGDEVADVALGYVIMLARQLHVIDAGVRAGRWPKPVGRSLRGSTVCLVGLGSIGRAFALRAAACGMGVRAVDPNPPPDAATFGAELTSLYEALREADYIVLTCDLNPSTFHILDEGALHQAQRGVQIVNVARGGLVDEKALVRALRTGHVRAAALDVMELEPLPPSSDLRALPVIFGSHNASNTAQACARTHRFAIDNLLEHLRPL